MDERTAEVLAVIENVVNLFSTGQYEALEQLTRGVEYSAKDMRQIAEAWIYPLVPPPPGMVPSLIFDEPFALDPVPGFDPPYSDVEVHFYTEEEGPSELSANLWIIDKPDGGYRVEINRIGVM